MDIKAKKLKRVRLLFLDLEMIKQIFLVWI